MVQPFWQTPRSSALGTWYVMMFCHPVLLDTPLDTLQLQ
jgi:hypothetical protein